MPNRRFSIRRLVRDVRHRCEHLLFREIDIASLAFFRIAFGTLMFVEVWRLFAMGDIGRYWVRPSLHFKYAGFEWLQPWSGEGMYWHFLFLGLVAAFIALGFLYRLSAALFFLGYTYVFLLEAARYQNHYYLICLVSFLMVLVPAHRSFSLDVALGRFSCLQRIPAWPVVLLGAQLAAVYFYGGIAKLNSDWLHGDPMRMWLSWRNDFPVIGPFLGSEVATWIWVFGGLLFDLLIVPLILWPKTRMLAWVMLLAFHGLNMILFKIGIFPVMAIFLTTILLPAGWPRRIFHPRLFGPQSGKNQLQGVAPSWHWKRGLALAIVVPYLLIQMLIPLRHHLYPGNVSWTEEGHMFAWRMKFRDKRGRLKMTAENRATGESFDCPVNDWLPRWQQSAAITDPRLLLQLAHYAAVQVKQEKGWSDVAIRAKVEVSLNGRPRYLIVHPKLDLTQIRRTMASSQWILPMGYIEKTPPPSQGTKPKPAAESSH